MVVFHRSMNRATSATAIVSTRTAGITIIDASMVGLLG
jgi:hypothetical protein